MIMANETIIELYKKALEDGNPARQIKSLAKTNNVKATVIKNILIDAGLDVPDHIPTGPMKKSSTIIEAADPVSGEVGYRKAAADDMTKKRVVMPDVVKEMIQLGLDCLDVKIAEYEAELEELKSKIEELKEKKRSTEEYMRRPI